MPYLPPEEFAEIYSRVPRLCVDVIIKTEDGILLSFRSIDPYKNLWHIPGGTIYKGEKLEEAASRIVKRETGLEVNFVKYLGYIEYLNERRFGGITHAVSIAIEATPIGGKLNTNEEATELKYFKDLPEDIIEEQGEFLRKF